MNITDIPRVKVGAAIAVQVAELDAIEQERLVLGQRAADLLGYQALVANVTKSPASGQKVGPLGTALLQLDIEVLDTGVVVRYQTEEAARRNQQRLDEMLQGGTVYRYATESWGWSPARWTPTELKSYTQPIPEFVLDKAVRIKELLPATTFYVQHLDEPAADPFLVVRLSDEVYYIEVWDEPRFEGRVTR